jgi:hypothetical protein
MSKRINSILLLPACILFLSGCSISKIPAGYRYGPKALRTELTGGWTEVKLKSLDVPGPEKAFSGELIAIQSDTMYILTKTRLEGIHTSAISEAVLYMYINRSGVYGVFTGLLYIPDFVAAIVIGEPAFFLLGVPWLVAGGIITLLEASDHSNLLHYPVFNQLTDLKKFARYPQGMPPGIERSRLHLILTR